MMARPPRWSMGTPADLTDFAVGFSLTEGIIQCPQDIETLDIVPGCDGIELRMWLTADSGRHFKKRQRRLIGPTGCGLCGIESLAGANRSFPRVAREISLRSGQIEAAVAALSDLQRLNHVTRATHAAGLYRPDGTLAAVREDVGRHNALDKLAGALAAEGYPGRSGAVILTSRVSIEMVQKTAAIRCPILVAISAPTALAVGPPRHTASPLSRLPVDPRSRFSATRTAFVIEAAFYRLDRRLFLSEPCSLRKHTCSPTYGLPAHIPRP